jgi:hypothetical protein
VLTTGRKPGVDWTLLRTYSLQNYFSSLYFHPYLYVIGFYSKCYLILSCFQILDDSYSPHNLEEHWTSVHWTASAEECATRARAIARLHSVRSLGGGTPLRLWSQYRQEKTHKKLNSCGKMTTTMMTMRRKRMRRKN